MMIFNAFGVLSSFFDFGQFIGFGQSMISGKVWTAFLTG